ncbi:Sec7 domain containing protein [Tritrichomonas foetus]|uniref:Sec7 domain containing protein n=1 Tax=Tritrichomonas foetus TaxID=1144522 RepID=A0A1J4JUZ1_9EUKA|nr:Sec7 domain containing protein [Tritrichomonas foetus]|eukprot:OHT01340.1 Sec7 domain containing protein [Tritrichomonas foetus]
MIYSMDRKICEIISDECHRMQAELRLTSQKSLIPDLQEEFHRLRFNIYSPNSQPQVSEIISPFQRMISHPRSTDVITSVAISSLYNFLKSGLFTTSEDITSLVQCLCSCQYQMTSEQDCLTLNQQIISTFILICSDRFSHLVSISAAESIFQYCEQDVRQLTINSTRSVILTQALSEISVLILTREDLQPLVCDTLTTLYYIADLSYTDSGWVARIAALSAFLAIAKTGAATKYHELIIFSCIILHQQLTTPDDRCNFVLSLRLFFTVFSENWTQMSMPFSKCFEAILDFCSSSTVSPLLKSTAFEILIDFVSLPKFPLVFYSNFSTRPFLPNLFEKFINVVMSFANVPAAVPDAQNVALSLITTIIQQITPSVNSENPRISLDPPLQEPFSDELEKYEKLLDFSAKFSEKSSSISKDYSVTDVSKMLFIALGISKSSLGEFFGKNSEFNKNVLQAYIDLFDFSNLSIDQSIRLFLSSFRIVGEGQIVDRLLDMFSIAFFNSHPNTFFHDAVAVHLFSVAWLMLHTSMHNKNVVKKDTLTDFLALLKGQNNGEDYDTQFLTSIFNSIKRSAISIEEDTQNNSPAYWELLIQRQKLLKIELTCNEPQSDTIKLFREIWQQAAPIYTILFDHSNEGVSLVLDTFTKCASIAALYQMHDVLDNLVVNLCRFTHSNSKNGLSEESSKKALYTLSDVVFDHGAQIQEGWKYFVELLLDLFRLDILPEEMRTQANLCVENGDIIIAPQMWQKTPRRNTAMLSFFRILTSYDNEKEKEEDSNDIKTIEQRGLVKDCKIHHIIDQSLHFSNQSLSYFLKSLILITHNFLPELDESKENKESRAAEATVCFHWVTQTATVNEERIQPLWKPVFELFLSVLANAQYNRTFLFFLQRILTSMFTLINHMWGQQKLRQDILTLLEKVASFDARCLSALLPELISGVNSFFSLHLQTFAETMQYQSVLTIFNASISFHEINPKPVTLVHSLVQKFNECKELPGINRMNDFYIPLLQTVALFCIKDPNDDVFIRFRDFQTILAFPGIEKRTPAMCDSIFEMVLFPSLARLTTEIPLQIKTHPNMQERALMMVRTVFKAFLVSYQLLSELPTFSCIWFKMVQFMLNLMKVNDADLKESIPEMLGNALLVMKESGIFQSNDDRKEMWLNSLAVIEPLTPSFKTMFHADEK